MKILEPFSGYRLASGHAYFHMAYFIATFFVAVAPVDYHDTEMSSHYFGAFQFLRWVHLIVFLLEIP